MERDTDTRQVLVGNLRRLAQHIRTWDNLVAEAREKRLADAEDFARTRHGLRTAAAIAFLGTVHTDELDERWIDSLLDEQAAAG